MIGPGGGGLVEPLQYAGDRPVIRKAYEDGRRYGRWEANNAITWDTTCLGCAAQLDATIRAHADGEVSGIRAAMAVVEEVASRISTADSRIMARMIRESMIRSERPVVSVLPDPLLSQVVESP